ncbi:MAG: hypothetical protein ACJAQ0_000223 [Dasania sp.]|jgi:uncharacterized protein (UPF0262 family)
MQPSLKSITFKENVFYNVDNQVQQECLFIASDFQQHGWCYPSIYSQNKKNNDAYLLDISLSIDIEKRYLILTFINNADQETSFMLSMSPYIRLIREYKQICHAYKEALSCSHASAIETIDMARRGLHNQAAELICERVSGKILGNHEAFRSFFSIMTLIFIVK